MGYKTKLLTILIPISITIVLFLTVEMIFRMYVPQDIYSEKQTIHQKRDENGNFVKPKTRTIYRCPEFDVSYEFDENGFRCSFKEDLNKSENDADKVKFLIIGDSFTFGAGNDYKSIWTSRLEEKLLNAEINVEIFNAGVPGYNTFAEVLLLEELAKNKEENEQDLLMEDIYGLFPELRTCKIPAKTEIKKDKIEDGIFFLIEELRANSVLE